MASLTPWRRHRGELAPRNVAQSFRRELGDLIEQFFGDNRPLERFRGRGFEPAVNLSENDDEIIVTAEVPGVTAQDIEVNIAGDRLTIAGEKTEEQEEKGDNVHWVERSYGSFSRSVKLPCAIETDKINARYKDGILTLKMPKCEPAKTKSVKIELNKAV